MGVGWAGGGGYMKRGVFFWGGGPPPPPPPLSVEYWQLQRDPSMNGATDIWGKIFIVRGYKN